MKFSSTNCSLRPLPQVMERPRTGPRHLITPLAMGKAQTASTAATPISGTFGISGNQPSIMRSKATRFCSEFGMQSYSSPQVATTYCSPDRFNIQGPEMENHQKNAAGNEIIFDYVSKRYRFPKDYAALAYLSQLNQAYCAKVAIEHFRRSMPQTMGALYWQLNDCWPVASWSSIEFGGRWKALHYEMKRAFAPALVSVHVPGDEVAGKGNQILSTIKDLHIYTVFDGLTDRTATLRWRLLQH